MTTSTESPAESRAGEPDPERRPDNVESLVGKGSAPHAEAEAVASEVDVERRDDADGIGSGGIRDHGDVRSEAIDREAVDRDVADRDAVGGGAGENAGDQDDTEQVATKVGRRPRLPAVLVILAVLLAGLAAWFTVATIGMRTSESARNTALVDSARTAEVSAAITSSLNRVFSYSYDRTEQTEKAAAEVLRGPALETYNQLFGQVRENAPEQKLVLTTRVVGSSVQNLTADDATLLVFLDQSATRADNSAASAAAAQLSVTAQFQDGHWVITAIEPR